MARLAHDSDASDSNGDDLLFGLDAGARQAIYGGVQPMASQIITANISGTNGDDDLSGTAGDDQLLGLAGNDRLSGLDGADRLDGGSGDDQLDGGIGADIMTGGSGNDIFYVDNVKDRVIENRFSGHDLIYSSVSYSLGGGLNDYQVDDIILTGTADINATGNGLNNHITGNSGANILDGGISLYSNLDTLEGGLGNDTYIVDGGETIIEQADGGVDEVRSRQTSHVLAANVENLTGLNSSGQSLTGNALGNHIVGTNAADLINGLGGADILEGKRGNDVYVVDDAADVVIEAANGGTDDVRTGLATYTLGANVENISATDGQAHSFTGNALGNRMTGGAGNDALDGGAGADYIDGGSGADSLTGGTGDDIYIVDTASDLVIEKMDAGIDQVGTGLASYTLDLNIENLFATNAGAHNFMGNSLSNYMIGGGGNDVLNGGTGTDILAGGKGDDIYYVDHTLDDVVENGGSGDDLIYASVSYTLNGRFVETLILTGSANISATGNAQLNTLVGNAGDNILRGGLGNDLLTGGGGGDMFGFDSILASNNIDRITDFSVADDTIRLSRRIFATFDANGTLATDAFQIGSSAADAEDHIIYNSVTGGLFYDVDGNGAETQILFARLTPGLALTNADILIVA